MISSKLNCVGQLKSTLTLLLSICCQSQINHKESNTIASYNKVILAGNATRDPEVKYTPKGTAVCEVGLAVNSTYWDKTSNTKKEDTVFVDVTMWAKLAETAGQYIKRGSSLLIEGRLQLDTFEDKATGQKRSKLRVVAETMQFLGSSPNRQQNERASVPTMPDVEFGGEDVPF